MKKNIAINALSALNGGGQTYLVNLLKHVHEFPDIRIYVFAPPKFSALYSLPGVEIIESAIPSKSILHRIAWERWKLPEQLRTLKANLVFCPGGTINFDPPEGCLTAVTFQNMLIFDKANRRDYKPGYSRIRLSILEKTSRRSFMNADLLIFLSDFAKKIIDREIPFRKGRSVVIPHGLDDSFRTFGIKDIPRSKHVPEGEYILYSSVLNVFKAQVEVIRAYHKLCMIRETKEKLLLVGTHYHPYMKKVEKEINRLGIKNKIIMTGQIPHDEMPSVYHHAKAHIYASTCENCPNIVIESLGSGKPLFLSNMGPMPELAGDAAVYFDPYKPDSLTELLMKHLDNEKWMKAYGEKAFERSRQFNWESTAREAFQAIKGTCNNYSATINKAINLESVPSVN